MIIPEEIRREILLYSTDKGNFSLSKANVASENLIKFVASHNISSWELYFLAKNNITDFKRCNFCNNPKRNFQLGDVYCSLGCTQKSLNNFKNINYYSNEYVRKYFFQFLMELKLKKLKYLGLCIDYIKPQTKLHYKCLVCGHEFATIKRSIQHLHCPYCLTAKNNKKKENNISKFIHTFFRGEIIKNTYEIIPPYELDVYLPEHNLGIEFNGDYWHSERYKNKTCHYDKFLKCWKSGIRLLQFFESEWDNKRKLCESYIKSAMGIYDHTTTYYYNLKQLPVCKTETNNFLHKNSFEKKEYERGIGLFEKNTLVFLIAINSNGTDCTFCSKRGYLVRGYNEFLKTQENSFLKITYNAMKFIGNMDDFELLGIENPSLYSVVQKSRVYDAGRMILKCK